MDAEITGFGFRAPAVHPQLHDGRSTFGRRSRLHLVVTGEFLSSFRGLASSSSTRFTERTSGFLPKQAQTTLAISLRLNGGYSTLRSTMSRLTFGGSLRLRAFSVESKPSMPYSSKLSMRRWRVRSETPVSSARSGTELP